MHGQSFSLARFLLRLFLKLFHPFNLHVWLTLIPQRRTRCISSLGKTTLSLPQKFLTNVYLKYFGWSLNDRVQLPFSHPFFSQFSPCVHSLLRG